MDLVANHLTVIRGGVPVLEGVSFTVRAGDALVLHGPNGSGKTTLLRTIAGLQPPHKGQVYVPNDAVAYAAHADGIKAQLTVRENLAFWGSVFGTDNIAAALKQFYLDPLANRSAGQLSAGQKRKLGLARMMLTGRPIWVLDEPTVSLDQEAVAMFADMVRGHLAGGGAALIATHTDLGLDAEVLDVARFKASPPQVEDDWSEGFA